MTKKEIPHWLLALILTVFWRVDRIRNALFPEVGRRWPSLYVRTVGQQVIVVPSLGKVRSPHGRVACNVQLDVLK